MCVRAYNSSLLLLLLLLLFCVILIGFGSEAQGLQQLASGPRLSCPRSGFRLSSASWRSACFPPGCPAWSSASSACFPGSSGWPTATPRSAATSGMASVRSLSGQSLRRTSATANCGSASFPLKEKGSSLLLFFLFCICFCVFFVVFSCFLPFFCFFFVLFVFVCLVFVCVFYYSYCYQ